MKTIKIKFDTDNELTCKGLENLNQYTFQDGVIDIYVKSSLVVSNSVVGMTFNSILKDGSEQCETRNATYVKDKAQWYNESSDYTLYEMKLPKIMTLYSGEQSFNIVVSTPNEDSTKLVAMATSSNYKYNVNASANTDYEVIDTTEVERLDSLISDLTSKKQDKTDTNINVSDGQGGTYHTVVGSLNTLSNRVNTNVSDIATRKKEINALDTRVSDLESKAVETFHFVGSYESENEPNGTELNDFVKSKHETLHNGDSVLWVQTSAIYLCVYANEWTWSEITGLGKASNERYGVVKGSSTLNASGIAVELNNGDFKDIRVKIGNGDYSLDTWLNKLTTEIEDIEKGNVVVGESSKATYDSSNNNIAETYMTKSDGATKTDMYEYALPRNFNDVYFLNYNDMVIQNASVSSERYCPVPTGQKVVAKLVYTNNIYQFELSRRNNISLRLYYACSNNKGNAYKAVFTINVFAREETTQLCTITKEITISDTSIHSLDIDSNLNILGDDIINITDKSNITVQVLVSNDLVETLELTLYSNATYPSTFQFNTDFKSISFNNGRVGEIDTIYVKDGVGYISSEYNTIAQVVEDTMYNLNLTLTENSVDYPYTIKVMYNGAEKGLWLVSPSSYGTSVRLFNKELFDLSAKTNNCLNVMVKFVNSQFCLVDSGIANKRYALELNDNQETSIKDLQSRVSELELKPNMIVENEVMSISYTETQVVDEVLDI